MYIARVYVNIVKEIKNKMQVDNAYLKYDLLYISTEHNVYVIINFQDPNFDFFLWTVTVILENCLINGPAHGVFKKT